jgi:quinol monooxygenase YgiN
METAPDRRIVRLAELQIDPPQLAAYTSILRDQIETSVQREPGVLLLYAMTVRDDPAAVRLTEVYTDEQAYQAHLQAPHFRKYKAETADMVLSLRLIEMDPLLLAGKMSR